MESSLTSWSAFSRAARARSNSGRYSLRVTVRDNKIGKQDYGGTPFVLLSGGLDCFKEFPHPSSRHTRNADRLTTNYELTLRRSPGKRPHLQMFVKFVQDQTHAIHKTVHVGRLPFCIAAVGSQRCLERLKILHPLQCKCMRLNVGLVEHKNERELCFV